MVSDYDLLALDSISGNLMLHQIDLGENICHKVNPRNFDTLKIPHLFGFLLAFCSCTRIKEE